MSTTTTVKDNVCQGMQGIFLDLRVFVNPDPCPMVPVCLRESLSPVYPLCPLKQMIPWQMGKKIATASPLIWHHPGTCKLGSTQKAPEAKWRRAVFEQVGGTLDLS